MSEFTCKSSLLILNQRKLLSDFRGKTYFSYGSLNRTANPPEPLPHFDMFSFLSG